ncbi:NADH-quinone oxidoreductase subunit K [Nesterenkonia sp. NBAIMH1]|uniref:NADH-quinone oxidoreductase subunit K n=1 Tax=Nesterenkonia sp. NBAIMH1 TaxID=2600320 RepID=UPI0011B4A953|nr:NADH-quinone oxidoreductase subunit K [Nesterenkonia sp. NBAIMH1]
MSTAALYLILGTAVAVSGTVRMLLVRDAVARLIAMNVVGVGSLLVLMAIAARAPEGTEPVLSALVITGLVITVAFTGFGAVLIRRIEEAGEDP